MKRQNFTVIEILAVVGIIAILAGITLGIASYVGNKNKETRTQTAIKLIAMAFENYKKEFGAYPFPQTGLTDPYIKFESVSSASDAVNKAKLWGCFNDVVLKDGTSPTGIKGLTLQKEGNDYYVMDGWNHKMIYLYPGVFNQTGFDIGSLGPNGLYGEESDSATSPGSRTSGNYKSYFGLVDDITNFKR